MSTGFPARARLAHVAASLAAHLPEQFGDLLAASRYADDAAALVRLSNASALRDAISEMAEREADWLAERLLERWRRIAEPVLDPAVAIVGPIDVWVADAPREIELEVRIWGIDEGWRAEWSGDARAEGDGSRARLVVSPLDGDHPQPCRAAVRVFGRADGARSVFLAQYRAQVRRIELDLDSERRRIVLRDQTGVPGVAVAVEYGGGERMTGADGSLDLERSLAPGTRVRIGGCEFAP